MTLPLFRGATSVRRRAALLLLFAHMSVCSAELKRTRVVSCRTRCACGSSAGRRRTDSAAPNEVMTSRTSLCARARVPPGAVAALPRVACGFEPAGRRAALAKANVRCARTRTAAARPPARSASFMCALIAAATATGRLSFRPSLFVSQDALAFASCSTAVTTECLSLISPRRKNIVPESSSLVDVILLLYCLVYSYTTHSRVQLFEQKAKIHRQRSAAHNHTIYTMWHRKWAKETSRESRRCSCRVSPLHTSAPSVPRRASELLMIYGSGAPLALLHRNRCSCKTQNAQ